MLVNKSISISSYMVFPMMAGLCACAEPLVRVLGYSKEIKDLLMGRGLEDTLYDLQNNEKGMVIGGANKNLKGNKNNLFDFIYETEIKPYRK